MKGLLDTHILLWILLDSPGLRRVRWVERYQPWGISPISLLEIQFLVESKKLGVQNPEFLETLVEDPRFLLDEVPLVPLIRHALELTWTRDPFDRLLSAHSSVRRLPLCTVDRNIRLHHRLVPGEVVIKA